MYPHIDFEEDLKVALQDDEERMGFAAEGAKLKFGAALLYAREARGITRAQLAEMSGFSESYLDKIELGDVNPTIGKLGAIFGAMGYEPTIWFEPIFKEDEDEETSSEPVPSADAERDAASLEAAAVGDGD